jgi:hypothetical protein
LVTFGNLNKFIVACDLTMHSLWPLGASLQYYYFSVGLAVCLDNALDYFKAANLPPRV